MFLVHFLFYFIFLIFIYLFIYLFIFVMDIFFFCYVNLKLGRFLVNKNGVFSFVVGRY